MRLRVYILAIAYGLSAGVFAQQGTISVRYIGNCGMQLSDGNKDVFLDFPYKSGAYGYMRYDSTQLDRIPAGATLLFTHRHADHYKRKLVKPYKKQVYGPWKNKVKTPGDTILTDSEHQFAVQAYRTKHRFARHHYSYLITWHGKRIFFSGDTEHPETIGSIPHMDVAFVPPWIFHYLKEQGIEPKADLYYVYHIYPTEQVKLEGEHIHLLREQDRVVEIPY